MTYYRRLKPRAEHPWGSPISIGNLVHDSLAAHYDPAVRANPLDWADNKVREAVSEFPEAEIDILKEWDLVQVMLNGYMEWLEETGADSDLRFIGSERKVEVPLIKDRVNIISKLDAPVEQISDGAKLALEHKTVGSLEQPLELLKIDTQLLTEHLCRFLDAIEKGATPEEAYAECHGILYNMLKKVKQTYRAKPPFYKRVTVPHNIHELRNHWKHVYMVAREIEDITIVLDLGHNHHDVVPPTPNRDCSWSCPFFKVCHMFDDGSRVEDALDAMFVEADPLERYQGSEEL